MLFHIIFNVIAFLFNKYKCTCIPTWQPTGLFLFIPINTCFYSFQFNFMLKHFLRIWVTLYNKVSFVNYNEQYFYSIY